MTSPSPFLDPDERIAMLPGDGDPEDHIVEQTVSSKGLIQRKMEQAREGHRIAEEHPERGAYHGGPPLPDKGGETFPYDQLTAAPSLYEDSRPRGETKMKVQTFDEAKAELARERAKLGGTSGSIGMEGAVVVGKVRRST